MKKQICLLWHSYPSENLGVGALSCSHIYMLDNILKTFDSEAEYFVVGMMPDGCDRFSEVTGRRTEYFHFSLKALIKKPTKIFKLVRMMQQSSIILDLSEGDSFTDIYGIKRLLQQTLSKVIAICSGTPLVLSPQTIGPFNTRLGQFVAAWTLKRIFVAYARDDQSYQYLLAQGSSSRSHVASDLAFLLPYERSTYSFRKDCIHVGLNVSGLLMNGGYVGSNQFGLSIDYMDLIDGLLRHFTSQPDTQVHLIAHVISDRYELEDDYRACEKLAEVYPNCLVAPKFTSPSAVKSYIANLDFFSGARMHSTIAALSAGVAVVPIAYSRKFSGLFGALGYDYVVDGSRVNTKEAVEAVISGFSERRQLALAATRATAIAEERLAGYERFLDQILRGF